MDKNNMIIGFDDPILITGSNGFMGYRVVETLRSCGFRNLRCVVRSLRNLTRLDAILASAQKVRAEVMQGNLLSREDCEKATKDVTVIFHLAAGIEKTFPGSFMNSVVTTRNLLDAALRYGNLQRFVNISSFAIYSNWNIASGGLLDETCELENRPVERAEAYTFAKLKQDQLLLEYAQKHGVPYVILRLGAGYCPGAPPLTDRERIDTHWVFFHIR